MNHCTECGKEVNNIDKYCANCGSSLVNTVSVKKQTEPDLINNNNSADYTPSKL